MTSQRSNYAERIVQDPSIMAGKPIVRSTRIPVERVLQHLDETQDLDGEPLTEEPFSQPCVRELLRPRDYTMTEATHILGSAIGKPDLTYVQLSYEDAGKAMLDMGASPSFADAVMETARGFNERKVRAKEKRSAQNTTPTTLEHFAQDVFRTAYRARS